MLLQKGTLATSGKLSKEKPKEPADVDISTPISLERPEPLSFLYIFLGWSKHVLSQPPL